MEIERKFLIKEGVKTYYSPFDINALKKEIKSNGFKIEQYYLPLENLNKILRKLNFKLKFESNEIRLRKIEKDFFITFKSKGSKSRHEFERKISREDFEEFKNLASKKIEKIRLMKEHQNKKISFDYIPKHALIIAEIEFKSPREAFNFKTHMKDITGEKKYKTRNLAEEI